MTPHETPSRLERAMNGPGPRLLLIGLLILLLLIPLAMIEGRVLERESRRAEAAANIAQSWGQAQTLAGPVLRLPYRQRWQERVDGKPVERTRSGWLMLPPQRLAATAQIDTEVRRRGIFEVPVYGARFKLNGHFELPHAASLPVALDALDFSRAEIMLGLNEPRTLSAASRIEVGGQVLVLESTPLTLGGAGVHAVLRNGVDVDRLRQGITFGIELNFKGSSAIHLAPVARETTLALHSNWPHPSFGGGGLPSGSRISDQGFDAQWSVSHLGRSYPPVWIDDQVSREQIDQAAFGVELWVPVDPYRMAERIAKYGALLLLLSFAAIWVMELLGGKPLHPVQYLLLGGSLCLFGLLQLALAEHLGFDAAYVLAAAAVVLQASGFARSATGSARRAAAVGALLSSWFGYLYVVLQAEDLAFLLGALALFVALTAMMWATRSVDWSTGQRGGGRRDVAGTTVEVTR